MKIKEIIMPKTTFKLEFEVNAYIEQTIKILSPGLNDALNLKLSKNPTLEQFREDLKFQLSFEDLDWKYFLETAQRAYEEYQPNDKRTSKGR